MKFQELNNWAVETAKKDVATLTMMGIKPEKLSKIKSILKDGISIRCKLVIENTEKNNKYINEIEEFIKQLTVYGLDPLKQMETLQSPQQKK